MLSLLHRICPSYFSTHFSLSFTFPSLLSCVSSFFLFFLIVWWGGAFFAASIESNSRSLSRMSMSLKRSSQFEWSPCRISEAFDEERTISKSTLVCFKRKSPKQLKCTRLDKMFWKFFFFKDFYFDVVNLDFFSTVRALVSENFRFPVCILSPTFSVLCLKSHSILWSCCFWNRCLQSKYPFLFFANVENRLSEPSADQ